MTPAERCEYFALIAKPWMNSIALMLGGPVYLVGSCLTSETPGDIDIRCMMEREQISALWGDGALSHDWPTERYLFHREMLKQSRRMSRRLGMHMIKGTRLRVDFQIETTLYSSIDGMPIMREGRPILRLDDVPMPHFSAGIGDP